MILLLEKNVLARKYEAITNFDLLIFTRLYVALHLLPSIISKNHI